MNADDEFVRLVLAAAADHTHFSIASQDKRYNELEICCRSLGLLDEGERLSSIDSDGAWIRGGSESYVLRGTVKLVSADGDSRTRIVMAKAYAQFGAARTAAEGIRWWRGRAALLSGSNVSIPKIFGSGSGTLFVEYIEYTLVDVLTNQLHSTSEIMISLRRLVEALERLNLTPIGLLYDLRTDGSRVYLVDFGEDLGEIPGLGTSGTVRRVLDVELRRSGFHEVARMITV